MAVATGVIVGAVISVASCGAAATAGAMVAGALIGAGIEIFMQTAIQGNTLGQVNWLKVGVAAVSGALCAIPGIGWFGAALIGGATNAAMTAIDGGSLEDCLKSFVIGVATGVLIHGATKLIGKASSAIANKLGKCFVAGTAVLTLVNGVLTAKHIEDIQVGDIVASRNEISGAVEYKPVMALSTSVHSEIVKVGTDDGSVISSSVTHPYYVVNRGYVEASELRAGDRLLSVNGEVVVVEFVRHEILESPQTLYNFEVDGNNNYYVSENANSNKTAFVLVHNYCKSDKVYLGYDKLSGKKYVGRTGQKDVKIRMKQHLSNKKTPRDLENVKYIDKLTEEQAKLMEQALINDNGGIDDLSNAINGISKTSNPNLFKKAEELREILVDMFKKGAKSL